LLIPDRSARDDAQFRMSLKTMGTGRRCCPPSPASRLCDALLLFQAEGASTVRIRRHVSLTKPDRRDGTFRCSPWVSSSSSSSSRSITPHELVDAHYTGCHIQHPSGQRIISFARSKKALERPSPNSLRVLFFCRKTDIPRSQSLRDNESTAVQVLFGIALPVHPLGRFSFPDLREG
jgi:hypothetical protein